MKNLPSVRGTPVRSTKVTEADGHRKTRDASAHARNDHPELKSRSHHPYG
jgi:hypothetical protein